MDQTTARLRKTFKYPIDNNEDDDLPDAMDEEEQDTLIRTLNAQNAKTNNTYRQILLLLPLLSIIPYLPSLLNPKTTFLSLLSVTSLLSTSYLLYFLPPTTTGFQFLDKKNHQLNQSQSRQSGSSGLGSLEDEGPVKKYLPYLNLVLVGVLSILGEVVGRKVNVWTGFAWLPGLVYGVVVLAKWVMGSVDPEGELSGLRYEFKGA